MGLMESMVPTKAVVALTRPPRLRKFRSSTVNQWQMLSRFSSTHAASSAAESPALFCWTARYSSKPSPREALRESTTCISASGNSDRRSLAAITADW